MEMPTVSTKWFDPKLKAAFHDLPIYRKKLGDGRWAKAARQTQDDPEFPRRRCAQHPVAQETTRPWEASGADDRPKASICWGSPASWSSPPSAWATSASTRAGDVDLCYAAAQAHNRMMTSFCAVDRRLLATAYVPLVDFDRAKRRPPKP